MSDLSEMSVDVLAARVKQSCLRLNSHSHGIAALDELLLRLADAERRAEEAERERDKWKQAVQAAIVEGGKQLERIAELDREQRRRLGERIMTDFPNREAPHD